MKDNSRVITLLIPIFCFALTLNGQEKIKDLVPALEILFLEHAQENNFPGYAYGIVADGEPVLLGAVGTQSLEDKTPVTIHSAFRIASLTKGFTAMAIMKLMEDNKLSLHDPVSMYIPGFKSANISLINPSSIIIEQLLTMSAGLPEDNAWADRHLDMSDGAFEALINEGFSFSNQPGTQFEYSNLSYALLGEIISEVSGKPYQQYITEEILEPMGMHHTNWDYSKVPKGDLVNGYRWEDEQWKKEPMLHDGAFGAIGGLITCIDDFSKYIAFQLSAQQLPRNENEAGPIKRASLLQMQQLMNPRLITQVKNAEGNPCPYISAYGYGLGISVDCRGVKKVTHTGGLPGFGSDFQFYPDYGIGIFSFSNRTYSSTHQASAKVMRMITEKTVVKPPRSIPSSILTQRRNEVIELIQTWDENLEDKILAVNFYFDISKVHRMEEAKDILNTAGKILGTGPIIPENRLRGSFMMYGENANIDISFSLSPENPPKIQRLNIQLSKK